MPNHHSEIRRLRAVNLRRDRSRSGSQIQRIERRRKVTMRDAWPKTDFPLGYSTFYFKNFSGFLKRRPSRASYLAYEKTTLDRNGSRGSDQRLARGRQLQHRHRRPRAAARNHQPSGAGLRARAGLRRAVSARRGRRAAILSRAGRRPSLSGLPGPSALSARQLASSRQPRPLPALE